MGLYPRKSPGPLKTANQWFIHCHLGTEDLFPSVLPAWAGNNSNTDQWQSDWQLRVRLGLGFKLHACHQSGQRLLSPVSWFSEPQAVCLLLSFLGPFCPHGVQAKPALLVLTKPYPNIPKRSGFTWCSSCAADGLVPPQGVALA